MNPFRFFLIGVLAFLITGCQPAEQASEDLATAQHNDEPAQQQQEQLARTQPGATATEPPSPAENCQLSVGWHPREPYHFGSRSNAAQGLDIDLIELLATESGCEVQYIQDDRLSLLRRLGNGDIDLLPGAAGNDEQKHVAFFSYAYRQETPRLYVRHNDVEKWHGETMSSLLGRGFRIGLTEGQDYGDELGALRAQPESQRLFIEASVGELNLTHLLDHRLDGFIADPLVAVASQRRRPWRAEVEPLPIDLETIETHLLFSRKSVEESIVERFNLALAQIRDDGRLEALIARYRDTE